MSLDYNIISEFVKNTNDKNKDTSKEATVYGTVVTYDGRDYVKIDGSELLTPVQSTVSTNDGDKVTVVVGNHTATVTGNVSDPSASSKVVAEQGGTIKEFETVMAYKVTTKDLEAVNAAIENLRVVSAKIQDADIINAKIESLYAKFTTIENLTATDIKAITADIESLEAEFGKFGDVYAEEVTAAKAEITKLKGYTADFTYVIADELEAVHADIKKLDADKLTAKEADLKYADIDFANINEAAVKKIFSDYGIINELVISEGTVVKELVGVTIKGDLIEAGTVKVDRLVVKGTDGQYYALNTNFDNIESVSPVDEETIHGSVMAAKSITAEKVRVDDLVAFGATIGGFNIRGGDEETPGAIYSGVKESIDNTTQGIYLDDEGQAYIGDGNNFLKFFKDADGNYKLDISANELRFAASGKTIEETLNDAEGEINRYIGEQVSNINSTTSSITASVSSLEKNTKEQYDGLIEDIERLEQEVALKIDSDSVQIDIQKIVDDGVSRVDTGTGFTFDDKGMTIDKKDSDGNSISPTNTNITENGMTVNNNETGNAVLTANKDGVDAENLHATTYLIVGGRSRFENYPENRTACFWIGN